MSRPSSPSWSPSSSRPPLTDRVTCNEDHASRSPHIRSIQPRSDSQRDTPLTSAVAQRITPHKYRVRIRATPLIDQSRIFAGRNGNSVSLLSCILSRQPVRHNSRYASSPPLRFGPPGVRSGTQPTVVVAKGKSLTVACHAPFA
jgi:hypothetical protein